MALIPLTTGMEGVVSSHVAVDWPAPRLSKTGLGRLKLELQYWRSSVLGLPVLFPATSFYYTCGKL